MTSLSLDEYEALRLADYLHMEQEEAATEMEISRPTFTRLLERARSRIAAFIVEGKALSIEGGAVHFRFNIVKCLDCERMFHTNIASTAERCPNCGSTNLLDMAGGFGHGRCCRERSEVKGGGKNAPR